MRADSARGIFPTKFVVELHDLLHQLFGLRDGLNHFIRFFRVDLI
jgi:hypothetical protein